MKKIIGVIGGMGPIATSHFMELIIKMTDAGCDQEHLNMIVYNNPCIPDRTAYILDNTAENPLPAIIETGKNLEKAGADYLCMPCITAHYFCDVFEKEFEKPLINIVKETVLYLNNAGIKKVGIMATDGTVAAGFLQKEINNSGMETVLPGKEGQKKVMSLIYDNVKANLPADMNIFRDVKEELVRNGAEVIILGCTELSLIKRDKKIGSGFIDAMEVLAKKSIELCGGRIKEEYKSLIS